MGIRNKKERQEEIKIIIKKLTELQLTVIYEPVRSLLISLRNYVEKGENTKINIPFPEIHKNIVGYLPINNRQKCWIKLTSEL
tara:strand:+ start:607 stop:855 length:249 start_codon:yes stop_codon:yes gene_type:complete